MSFRKSFAVGLALILAGSCVVVSAQGPVGPPPPQGTPTQVFTPQQLNNLVAPIALYPDPLLGQVLAASTYPLEVVEAQQWLQRNSGLSGTALMDAARQQNWDPSVQALVAFPDVLARMNSDVRWTTDLGNAFLAQQADVMYAVQRMRASAQANGKLSSSPQQTVTTQNDNGQSAIEILPASPQVIYVPQYDPAYIWGPPAWGYYPSLFYPTYGFGYWPGINIGLYFGGWGGWGGWGWGPNWFGHGLFVNTAFFGRYGFGGGYGGYGAYGAYGGIRGMSAWAHNPSHRLGVPYSNGQLAQRFGAASRASAASMGSRYAGSRYAGGQSFGASRGAAQSSRAGAGAQYGNRSAAQSYRPGGQGGYQSFRNSAPQNSGRSYQSSQSYQSRPSAQSSAPRYSGGNARSYSSGSSGGGARSFGGGGGGGHSFGGGGHSGGGGHGRR